MSADTSTLTHLPVSGTVRSPTIDFSSLKSLASCQWQWYQRYVIGAEDKPSMPMRLGTLMHDLTAAYWSEEESWQTALRDEIWAWHEANPAPQGSGPILSRDQAVPEIYDRAFWLMERYEKVNEADRHRVKVLGTEVPFRLRLPGRYGWLVGRIDHIWEFEGRQWVVERKTMSDFSAMDRHERSHQTTFYFWAARQLGYDPWGIMLEGIRTYRWKRDEHPPEDSFERRSFDRNSDHLDGALLEAGKGLTLAKRLIAGDLLPMRNIDDHCSWCPYENECMADLAFTEFDLPDTYEMEP